MRARLSARISPAIVQLVERAAPANESAGAKALLILGASLAGYDLTPLRRDIALLLAESLDPVIEAQLRAVSDRQLPSGVQVAHTYEAAYMEPQSPDDPFAVGFEV